MKEINKRKKMWILSKILWFSRQQQLQKIQLFKYYTEKNKKKVWIELASLGQEPTLKSETNFGKSVLLREVNRKSQNLFPF